MNPIYCRICQYNPCMCGAAKRNSSEYMTEEEARRVDREEFEKLYTNDPWANPPSPFDE